MTDKDLVLPCVKRGGREKIEGRREGRERERERGRGRGREGERGERENKNKK